MSHNVIDEDPTLYGMSLRHGVRKEQCVDAVLMTDLVDGENNMVLLRCSQSCGSTHALRRCVLGGILNSLVNAGNKRPSPSEVRGFNHAFFQWVRWGVAFWPGNAKQ